MSSQEVQFLIAFKILNNLLIFFFRKLTFIEEKQLDFVEEDSDDPTDELEKPCQELKCDLERLERCLEVCHEIMYL